MPRKRIIKMTAVAGIVGPILFAAARLSLTVLQYDFMVGIGWQPWRDPAGTWPSGLALGPYGWAQTASFIVSGVLLMIFATGLHLGVTGGFGSRAGPGLLLVSGTAMALMGFETDPIRRTGPRTLHGLVHDLAFVLFVLTLLLAFFFLWRRLRGSGLWRGYACYTLATGLSATLLLLVPGSTSRMQLPPDSASPPHGTKSRRWKSPSPIANSEAHSEASLSLQGEVAHTRAITVAAMSSTPPEDCLSANSWKGRTIFYGPLLLDAHGRFLPSGQRSCVRNPATLPADRPLHASSPRR